MSFSRTRRFQSLDQFEKYLSSALKALDSNDRRIQSEALLLLSKNELSKNDFQGYEVIRYITEAIRNPHYLLFGDPLRILDFDQHILPFIRILVHDAFTQTCLEKSFRDVIKVVYCPDGERATRFFNRVLTMKILDILFKH